jgi:hypothetical protein
VLPRSGYGTAANLPKRAIRAKYILCCAIEIHARIRVRLHAKRAKIDTRLTPADFN